MSETFIDPDTEGPAEVGVNGELSGGTTGAQDAPPDSAPATASLDDARPDGQDD